MKSQVTVSYNATLIGVRKDSGSFVTSEAMVGLCKNAVDLLTFHKFLQQWFTLTHKSTKHIDLSWKIITDNGYTFSQTSASGFASMLTSEVLAHYIEKPTAEAASMGVKTVAKSNLRPEEDETISDDRLTLKQLRKRQEMLKAADDRAFGAYSRRRGN